MGRKTIGTEKMGRKILFFVSSLLVEELSSPVMVSARDILKPYINEVLQCWILSNSKQVSKGQPKY
jgi:hypothetical protein